MKLTIGRTMISFSATFPSRAGRRVSLRGCHALCALAMLALLLPSRLAAADETAEALKQRIVAAARTVTANDYAFTRTARNETRDETKTEKRVVIERFDPTKSADSRWTLVSINGQPPSAEEQSKHRKNQAERRVANYGRIAEYFTVPATVAESQGRKVLKFEKVPKGSVVINDADVSANAIGEATINETGETPFVEQMRFTSTKPTRVKLVAVVQRIEVTTRYRMMPNGKPVPVEQVSETTGSMLGKQGSININVTYSDHRAVR
jgi:hypothetical protein